MTDSGKGRIGKSVSTGEVGSWVEGRCEEEPKPLQAGLGVKDLILKVNQDMVRSLIAPRGPSVNQFGFGDGEGDLSWEGFLFEH